MQATPHRLVRSPPNERWVIWLAEKPVVIRHVARQHLLHPCPGKQNAQDTRSYSSVAAILKNARDRKEREPEYPSLFHENIRGPGYYH
jgi:hypothetical protein